MPMRRDGWKLLLSLAVMTGVNGCGGGGSTSTPPNYVYSAVQIALAPPISYAAPAINSNGMVAGASPNSAGVIEPFVWSQSGGFVPLDLGVYTSGAATGINDAGVVVGWFTNVINEIPTVAGAVWNLNLQGTQFTTVQPAPGTQVGFIKLVGINNQGTAVGWEIDVSGLLHPIMSAPYSLTKPTGVYISKDLTSLVGTNYATAINDKGDIVGGFNTTGTAFYLPSGGKVQSLGTVAGTATSTALAINNQDQVVGSSGPLLGFTWSSPGGIKSIGPSRAGKYVQCYAYGINDSGTVVGGASPPVGGKNGADAAYVYSASTGFRELTPITEGLPGGVSLTAATAINKHGLIVAVGSDSYAYLLTPVDGVSAARGRAALR